MIECFQTIAKTDSEDLKMEISSFFRASSLDQFSENFSLNFKFPVKFQVNDSFFLFNV